MAASITCSTGKTKLRISIHFSRIDSEGAMYHGTAVNSATAPSSERSGSLVVRALRAPPRKIVTSREDEAQFTVISQLLSWTMGKSSVTQSAHESSATEEKPLHHEAEQASEPNVVEINRVSQVEGREVVRQLSRKYKGSAPSRGTHLDYDSTADALWTGLGNRHVPDGLRKMAAGELDYKGHLDVRAIE